METLPCLLILSSLLSSSRATSINAGLSSIVNDIDFARSASHCAQVSARALFSPSNDLSIIDSSDSPRSCDIVRELLKATFADRSLKIFTNFSEFAAKASRNLEAWDTSFLVIDSVSNLRRLMGETSANRWAEYIIVVIQGTTEWLAEFAEYLSNLGFTNIAFVSVTTEGRSTLVRPVVDPASPTSTTTVRIFDICVPKNAANPTNPATPRRFSSLDPDDLSNRTVSYARSLEIIQNSQKLEIIKDGKTTSLGVDILRIFTNWHNIELVRSEWPNQSDLTWTEAMQRCLAGEFDYFYADLPPSRSIARGEIEAVVWFKYDFLTFVDTPKKPTMNLSDILTPFHRSVWLCAFGLFGAFAVFAYAIDRLWQQGLIRERITVLAIWCIFVDQSLPALPVKFGLRFVIGMWVFHNFLKNAGYTAMFSSALTTAADTNVLKTFQDVWESGKPICGVGKIKELLNDPTDPVIFGIHSRFKEMHPRTLLDAVLNQSCIGIQHRSSVERHNLKNRANESRRLYTPSKAIILQYPSFYFARKRNRYNKELRKIITRAYEAGIVSRTEQKYWPQQDKTGGKMSVPTEDPNLRLTHLLIVFQLLLVGHFISLVVFVIEIYAHTHYHSPERFDVRKS